MIWFIISWFAAGLISVAALCVRNMRGADYYAGYFDGGIWFGYLVCILSGYIAAIMVLFIIVGEEDWLGRLVWRLCNIGVKKNEDKEGATN